MSTSVSARSLPNPQAPFSKGAPKSISAHTILMLPKKIAYKHYLRALSRWPQDALRPECQFQDVMRKRLDSRFPTTASSPSVVPSAASTVNEKIELEQANALYSLLENRYAKAYPPRGSLMSPQSCPTHYADLIRELEAAPQRSWLERLTNRWKGFLRFE